MTKKAIVFGSQGQLGRELCADLASRGYEIREYDRDQVDICDQAAVEKLVAPFEPTVVFNAAAYNMVDVAEEEPEAAYRNNGLAVRNLALACHQVDARLIHYSTDYVFDGTLGRPYVETDATHPIGAYGVSKLVGEIYAQAYLDRPLIVRTSGVFGPAGRGTPRGNFLETMLRLARKGQPIRVVQDYVASPAYAPLLAARSIDLYEHELDGVFHVGGGTPISWFDYAALIFKVAGVSPELIATSEREHRTVARRPKFSALSNAKMEAAGLKPMPPMEEVVKAYFQIRNQ